MVLSSAALCVAAPPDGCSSPFPNLLGVFGRHHLKYLVERDVLVEHSRTQSFIKVGEVPKFSKAWLSEQQTVSMSNETTEYLASPPSKSVLSC